MADVFYESNQSVSLATKHEKQRAIKILFKVAGFDDIAAEGIETTRSARFRAKSSVRELCLKYYTDCK